MFILQDLWRIIVFPKNTIKKIIEQEKLSSALLRALIWCGFFLIVSEVEPYLFFPSGSLSDFLNTLFSKSLIIKYLIYLGFFLIGYTIIHLLCFIFSSLNVKTYCYNRLVVTGGYLMTIGMPFIVFYESSNSIPTFTLTMIFGLPSLLLFLIKLVIVFIGKIPIWNKWLVVICGSIGFLVFIWIIILNIISVKEIYQFSTKKATKVVGISVIIFFILCYIFVYLPLYIKY